MEYEEWAKKRTFNITMTATRFQHLISQRSDVIFNVSPRQLTTPCANCNGQLPAGFACLACGAALGPASWVMRTRTSSCPVGWDPRWESRGVNDTYPIESARGFTAEYLGTGIAVAGLSE
jgi:hypothetical protein